MAGVLTTVTLVIAAGCSRRPEATVLDVGHHRVRLVLPRGWEHLDHGHEQIFRRSEMQISLTDLGPASRAGLVRDLREARQVWLQGRRLDAFERVRELRGPPLAYAAPGQVAAFWKPWWDMRAAFGGPDSAAIGAAFDSLIAGTADLPKDSPEAQARYALDHTSDSRGLEIARQARVIIRGASWFDIETWDRVAHLGRRRIAVLDNGGYLLVLNIDRGPFMLTNYTFERLLRSIEVLPGAAIGI